MNVFKVPFKKCLNALREINRITLDPAVQKIINKTVIDVDKYFTDAIDSEDGCDKNLTEFID